MQRMLATMTARIFRIALILVISLAPVSSRQLTTAATAAETCVDSRCLASLAAQALKDVDEDKLARFAEHLARAGLFNEAHAAAARISSNDPRAQYDRQVALRAIALSQVAATAWRDVGRPADLSPIDALIDMSGSDAPSRLASIYWLVASQILYRSPWTDVSAEIARLWRPKLARQERNATLDNLLRVKWPRAIERLPECKQGAHWDNVAGVWLDLGDLLAATEALDRAEHSGAYDFQDINQVYQYTARTWLRMGRLDRALAAARSSNSKQAAAAIQIEVAKALIAAGDRDGALGVLTEALANSRHVSRPPQIGFFLSILNLRLAAGDRAGASPLADEILALARKGSLLPSSDLALAAKAYNDLGERQRAVELLREAVTRVPGSNQRIGVGVVLGPITGSTPGLNDSIRSQIAGELYRAGRKDEAKALLGVATPEYRNRTWFEIYAAARRRGEADPSESDVFREIDDDRKLGFSNTLAFAAVSDGKTERATQLLQQVISEAHSEPHIGLLLGAAKIAVAGDRLAIAADALRSAARIALRIGNPGQRATQLALIAALQHEFVGR